MKKFIFKKPDINTMRKTRVEGKLNKLSYKSGALQVLEKREEKKQANLKVRLNISGDRRGMHNALAPLNQTEMELKLKAMRRFYSKAMPVLQCSSCAFSTQCSQFKAGYECAYLPFFKSHTIRNTNDLLEHAKDLLEANMQRAHVAMTMETLAGAAPSAELSESVMMLFSQLMALHERITTQQNATVEISASGDETIIGSLFGDIKNLLAETESAVTKPITQAADMAQLVEADPKMALAVAPESGNLNVNRDNELKLPSSKIEVVELT